MKSFKLKQLSIKFVEVNEETPEWIRNNNKLARSSQVFDAYKHLKDEAKEFFIALHLNSKNNVICQDVISIGSLNASIVHPREVFKAVLMSSAAAVVFVHNHPSGDPTPSAEDISMTNRLSEAGDLLGIRVMDHVIIGEDRYVSLADRGLMNNK